MTQFKQHQITINLRHGVLELTVEPRPGDFVKVIDGINRTRNCLLDRLRLDMFEHYNQRAIKNALIAKAKKRKSQDD